MNREELKVYVKKIIQEVKDIRNKETLGKNQKAALEHDIFNKLIESDPKCRKCGRTDNLTLDHIVPQSILFLFGVDINLEVIPGNYQILCRLCNQFKSSRLDFAIPDTKELMFDLLNTRL